MPNYFVRNKTGKRLYVPPPVNKTLDGHANVTVYVAASEMEVPAIRNMVAADLLTVVASDNTRLTDELEVPVLSMIKGGSGAPLDASYLTLTANPLLTNERTLAVSSDLTQTDGGPNSNLTLSLSTTGVTPGSYGSGSLVPVFAVDSKGRITSVTTASNFAAHEGYDTLAHDIVESNFQEVLYSLGLVTSITYWTSAAKTLKIRESLFTYDPSEKVSSVTERHFDNVGAQIVQLVHTYSYNLDETLASISTVRT